MAQRKAKRAHVKKKEFRLHVRAQTLAGLINAPDGDWIPEDKTVADGVKKNVLEGTRGNSGGYGHGHVRPHPEAYRGEFGRHAYNQKGK